jgi:hypothetical protein
LHCEVPEQEVRDEHGDDQLHGRHVFGNVKCRRIGGDF